MRLNIYGRDGRIRTCDILIPNQALYQAELHPDETKYLFGAPAEEPLSHGAMGTARMRVVGMVGVEPTRHCCQGILSPSRLPFRHIPEMEVPTRFEPVITELQSIALPLG